MGHEGDHLLWILSRMFPNWHPLWRLPERNVQGPMNRKPIFFASSAQGGMWSMPQRRLRRWREDLADKQGLWGRALSLQEREKGPGMSSLDG
jgi:hypothetical protein